MKQKIPGKCLFIKRDDNETLTRDPTLVKINIIFNDKCKFEKVPSI